jgi:hypothetical protein
VNLKRVFGFLLVFAAAAGFVFSVFGLIEIWRYRPAVTQSVSDTLKLFDQALSTTQDGLSMIDQTVQTTMADVASLKTTTLALAQAIHDTNPALDSLANLTRKDFPAAVSATQTSLASAQSSALLIDNVLGTLTSIPFLPVAVYKPDVPLHTALAQVSTNLNSLTPALAIITTSLVDGRNNLSAVEVELNKISETANGMNTQLGSAKVVIAQYKEVVAQLKLRVEATQQVVSTWIMTFTWILSFVFGWLFFVELGLCMQGLDLERGNRSTI